MDRFDDRFNDELDTPGLREEEESDAKPGEEEAFYLRTLIDSQRLVTIFLRSGEQLRGRVRYYDRHCLSLGLEDEGPNVLLRKESILYLAEG